MLPFSSIVDRQPARTTALTAGMVIVLVFGVLDYFTGYEVSIFVFYGIPIIAVAWFVDRNSAILLAVFSGLIWWWADELARQSYRWNWLQAWETLVRLSFFIFAALSGALLRAHYESTRSRIRLLEHANRLEQEIINISEDEQRRIGQDLHDGICQYLAALGYSAASLQKDLEKAGQAEMAASAQDLAERLRDSITQVRNLARGLVPVQMDAIGLVSALEELTVSASKLLEIECVFDGESDTPVFDYATASHLYRIAQEAINNATRHGKASRVDVHLSSSNRTMELTVGDNGIGMKRGAGDSKGMGLSIMQYRARCLGGELKIEPRPTGGTLIRCLLGQAVCDPGFEKAAC